MNDNIQRSPPQIIHSEPRPEAYRQMIEDASRNIHLRKQSSALLLCYASHANHFRPALELIEKQTGIAKNKVSEIRKRLHDRGLISYNAEQGYIYIDWRRVRAFAMLEKPLRLPQWKRYYFTRTMYRNMPTPTIGQLSSGWHVFNPRP